MCYSYYKIIAFDISFLGLLSQQPYQCNCLFITIFLIAYLFIFTAVTYYLHLQSNVPSGADFTYSYESIAAILEASCASQHSVIIINITPGVYAGSNQMLDLTYCESVTSLSLVCTTANTGNSECIFVITSNDTFLRTHLDRTQLIEFRMAGIYLRNGSKIPNLASAFLQVRNLSCVYLINCTFSSTETPFIQGYNCGGNLQSTRFYVNSPQFNYRRNPIKQFALLYWSEVHSPGDCLGIRNLSFIHSKKQNFDNSPVGCNHIYSLGCNHICRL